MLGEGIVENLVERILERMREIESIKGPHIVQGFSLTKLGAIGERAEHGQPVLEPYGSTRNFVGFEDLMLIPAQVAKKPFDPKAVGTSVTIGPRAAKPLVIDTPIMLAGMAFGLSVTHQAKVAWGKAATLAGTACNSGDTGFYPPEREQAKKYIVQYNRAHFGNAAEELADCEAIEIRFGQGALGGLGDSIDNADVDEALAQQLGIEPGQSTTRPLVHKELAEGGSLRELIEKLRKLTDGTPIGAKIAAGNIEEDLEILIDAGCDFITIDGAQGGTANSPEVTINNLGVPLTYAIPRAARFLRKKGVTGRVSLIVTGGLRDAGDIMKALALGADAVYLGEAALVAMGWNQFEKLPLGTSPAEIYLAWGKHADKLDPEVAAQAVANFIKASTTELQMLTGAVGKMDISEVNEDDLVSLTPLMERITGVRGAWLSEKS